MKEFFSDKRQVPIAGLVFFMAVSALMAAVSMIQNDGRLIYYLDDTYIHLSTARMLSGQGVWGVAAGQFVFCSSSPHYAALLALLFRLGQWEYWPLAVNLVAAVACIGMFSGWMRRSGATPKAATGWLLLWICLLPLPFLALIGMEHTLQIAVNLLFLQVILRSDKSTKSLFIIGLTASLVTGMRYEGMYVVAAAAALMAWEGQWSRAIAAGMGGAATVAGYGLYSLAKGGGFFPTSILLKGYHPGPSAIYWLGMIEHFIDTLHKQGFISVFMVLLALATVWRWFGWEKGKPLPDSWRITAITLGALLMHLPTSKVGGVRYEAYLIASGMLGLFLQVQEAGWMKSVRLRETKDLAVAGLGIGLVLVPFLMRAMFFSVNFPRATNNIYSQQYQMALFLQQYHPRASVAANDIGAITYLTDIRLTDMVSLGDQPLLPFVLAHRMNTVLMDSLTHARDIDLAVIYDSWVGNAVPGSWIPVARWGIGNNFICGDNVVTWYATRPGMADTLSRQLADFGQHLPDGVKQKRILP